MKIIKKEARWFSEPAPKIRTDSSHVKVRTAQHHCIPLVLNEVSSSCCYKVYIQSANQCWVVLMGGSSFISGFNSILRLRIVMYCMWWEPDWKSSPQVFSKVKTDFNDFWLKLRPEFPYGLNLSPVLRPIDSKIFH